MNDDDIERYKRRHPFAVSVAFEGEQYPSVGQLCRHLAEEYEARAGSLSYWIRQRGADRQMLDKQFRRRGEGKVAGAPPRSYTGRPVIYNGRTFPSPTKFLTHLAAELELPYTVVSMAIYAHEWNLDAALTDLRAHLSGTSVEAPAANGAAAADTGPPVDDAEPESIETMLAEIGETIGRIRGAYEAREVALSRTTIGTDPTVARRLTDMEAQLTRQAAALKSLEQQLAGEHKSRERLRETVNLINRKLTQLAHDLKLEKIPTPTRRDPMGAEPTL
jgi:uncharacterized coiled-coil protein SlyX